MPTLLPSEMRKKASLVLEREVTGILPRIVSATGSAHQQAPSTDVSTHTSRMLSLQLLLPHDRQSNKTHCDQLWGRLCTGSAELTNQ